jgi:hypothetical protein
MVGWLNGCGPFQEIVSVRHFNGVVAGRYSALNSSQGPIVLKKLAGIVRTTIFLAGILAFAAAPGFSQMNTGEIDGIVRDPTGAVVLDATVSAMEAGTQLKYTTKTNAAGEYLLAQLPVGHYNLTVSMQGFKQIVQPNVELHAGDHLRQPFTLELGEQSETLTVSVAPGLLQTESAAIQDTIQQQQVIDLPLKGRSFIDLVGLTPGVSIPPAGTRGSALQQTGLSFGILGQRTGHNLYLVDGVSVTDEAFNNLVLSPSVDDIQEVTVNQTSYDAEFGGKSGGVINVITKSGGNRFHGSVFEFVRNDVFDAKNFFVSQTQPIPPYKQNQFGASFGGPIQKDKTFFFLDYEGVQIRKSQTQLFNVPTALQRTGNTVDPVAAALLAVIPLPTPGLTGSNNLRATGLSTIGVNQYNGRVDHTFSSKDSAFVRGSILDDNEFDPFGSGALNEALLPGFGYNLRTHTDNLSATWTHVINTSWINELRFGWLWVGGGQSSPNAGSNFAGPTGLQGVTSNPLDTGYPQATITGFSTMGESTQYVTRKDNNYELYDNVLWHHGTHTVRFGGYFFHLDVEPVNAQNARGTFTFTGRFTGSGLGDFLQGTPNTGSAGQIGRGALQGRTDWAHFYFEDGWQITPSLKLDIGLRYEYNQNVTDANINMAIVNTLVPGGEFVIASDDQGNISPAASALLAKIPITTVTSKQAGWDRSLLQMRPLRLAPRIGLAWALPDHKTVIRSGFGIYTNQAAYNIIQNAVLNLPFYFSKSVTNSATLCGGAICSTENILGPTTTTGSVSASNLNHDFKIEYNNVWNLSVQHSFSSTTSFEAQYIGSYTVHADNQALQNLFPDNALAAGPLHVRNIPAMSGFTTISWDGWEKYHALALTFTQRLWHGLVANSTYTWSKALDDASNPGGDNAGTNVPQDMNNYAAEKGPADFDHRHRFVTSFLYQVPLLRNSQGWIHTAFGEWQVGGIWTLQSGAPFTVNLNNDNAHNGTPIFSQRPNFVCDPNSGPKTPAMWFTPTCFSQPALLTYGTAGRNSVIGPGLDNFDATIQKQFPIRESMNLQFRLDIFDFFNHPNFNAPVGSGRTFSAAAVSPFGSITSAQDPREMQFSLRLVF